MTTDVPDRPLVTTRTAPEPGPGTIDPADPGTNSDARWWSLSGDRPALIAFIAYLGGSALYILFGPPGADRWFNGDIWAVLTRTDLDPVEALEHWNGHWITLPTLLIRALYSVIGLNNYLPYLALAVTVHLAVVSLLRVVMRRSGVGAWTSTIVAAVLALAGSVAVNFIDAFQITLTGAVALGLGQLLATDHPGPFRIRDLMGLLLGLAALMSSGVGLTMVLVVATAVLIRRGPVAALIQSVPLIGIYLLWASVFRNDPFAERGRWSYLPGWVLDQAGSVATALGGFSALGWLVLAASVLGTVLRWTELGSRRFIHQTSMPLALTLGAASLALLTWWTRGFAPAEAGTPRYAYLQLALLLPIVAVGLYSLISRNRMAVVLLVPLLLAAPVQRGQLEATEYDRAIYSYNRTLLSALAVSETSREAPRWIHPDPIPLQANMATIGWVLDEFDSGRIPAPDHPLDKEQEHEIKLRLGVTQIATGSGGPYQDCRTLTGDERIVLSPEPGYRFAFRTIPDRGALQLQLLDDSNQLLAKKVAWDKGLPDELGRVVEVILPDLRIGITTAPPPGATGLVEVCFPADPVVPGQTTSD